MIDKRLRIEMNIIRMYKKFRISDRVSNNIQWDLYYLAKAYQEETS